jgi:hypothetical protein
MLSEAVDEQTIQQAVIEHLEIRHRPNVVWLHIPNGEGRTHVTGAILKSMGVLRGAPDIRVIIEGRAHFLELKKLGGKVGVDQVDAMRRLEAAGCKTAIAYGVDDAVRVLERWGAFR